MTLKHKNTLKLIKVPIYSTKYIIYSKIYEQMLNSISQYKI